MNNGIAFIGIIHIKAFSHVESWITRQKIAKSAIKLNHNSLACRMLEFVRYRNFGLRFSTISSSMNF